jgi:tellurite methyltransferase
MKLSSKYWNIYYKKKSPKIQSSNFANFVFKNFINKKKKNIIDIGCGNGRDSFFFAKKKMSVSAMDSSVEAIKKNILHDNINKNKISFYCLNLKESLKHNFKIKFDYIYLRFFLHTINKENEKILFSFFKKNLKMNGLVFFEFRTINDDLFLKGKKISKYERYTSHYRRFIDIDILQDEIKKNNLFKIKYIQERYGLSRTKTENPKLCRLILKKIN